VTLAALIAALTPAVAVARAPTVETAPVNTADVFSGADSPCAFDVTFTGTGTVTITTFYDNAGNPIRQSVHGALTHALFSASGTLTANGPAPVHIDLLSGQSVITGNEVGFHLPGAGVVFGQAGRLVLTNAGAQLSFTGLSTLDADALCTTLAP